MDFKLRTKIYTIYGEIMPRKKDVEKTLLEIFSPAEIDELVEQKMNEGARSEHSAMNKILRENDEREISQTSVEGYYLTSYVRSRDDTNRHAVLNDDGVQTIAGDLDTSAVERWEPVNINDVSKMQRLSTENTWMQAGDDTTIHVMDSYRYPLDDVLHDPSDINGGGLYAVLGTVQWVNEIPVDFDENNQPTGYERVLDGEDVNLKLVLTNQDDDCSVKLNSKEQLRDLLDIQDITWVNEDIKELKDMIQNAIVIVFGGGNDEVGGEKVTPFVQMRDFGFIEKWEF